MNQNVKNRLSIILGGLLLMLVTVLIIIIGITAGSADSSDINNKIKSNIQPSHAYKMPIRETGSDICISADEIISLNGNSMETTFFDGHTLLARNYTQDMILRVGDLVRYYEGDCNITIGTAIVHRITAIYNKVEVVVEGDNYKGEDAIKRCQITHIGLGVIFT